MGFSYVGDEYLNSIITIGLVQLTIGLVKTVKNHLNKPIKKKICFKKCK